jgi:hypothetical protein
MLCKSCNKPIEIGQKFVSGFRERVYFIEHAEHSTPDPKSIKTMTALRAESLAIYAKVSLQPAGELKESH